MLLLLDVILAAVRFYPRSRYRGCRTHHPRRSRRSRRHLPRDLLIGRSGRRLAVGLTRRSGSRRRGGRRGELDLLHRPVAANLGQRLEHLRLSPAAPAAGRTRRSTTAAAAGGSISSPGAGAASGTVPSQRRRIHPSIVVVAVAVMMMLVLPPAVSVSASAAVTMMVPPIRRRPVIVPIPPSPSAPTTGSSTVTAVFRRRWRRGEDGLVDLPLFLGRFTAAVVVGVRRRRLLLLLLVRRMAEGGCHFWFSLFRCFLFFLA
mmetsp:Transcript_4183/g.9007  ORF Transcript_4183/g.9007 Transcript_4183/m.9007 type:complete len:260 (+) Transcript_4183:284-1063(+)